jgi:thiol-disulfide isomerase/thioredoxin
VLLSRLTLRTGLVLLAACAGCGGSPAPAPTARDTTEAPATAREPELVRFGGLADVQAAIAAQAGHPCLVNFWATWCQPCVAEMPALRVMAREFAPRGARVLSVNLEFFGPDIEREAVLPKVRAFLAAREFELPTIVIEAEEYSALSRQYDLPGQVPITLAIDRKGRVVDQHLGKATHEDFRDLFETALKP